MELKRALGYFFDISILKTIYFNLKCCDFRTALHFPIIIQKGTKIKLLGTISILGPISFGLISFGRNCRMDFKGKIIFNGRTRIGPDSHFFVGQNGVISFGENFVATSELKINCAKEVLIGHNCLLSWGIQILDTDFHKIMVKEQIVNADRSVIIGNNIWIGFHTTILKGTLIKDHIIIGSNSLLNKSYDVPYSIYAGSPAILVKNEVTWDY